MVGVFLLQATPGRVMPGAIHPPHYCFPFAKVPFAAYVREYDRLSMHARVRACTCMQMCVCACVRACMCILFVCACPHVRVWARARARACVLCMFEYGCVGFSFVENDYNYWYFCTALLDYKPKLVTFQSVNKTTTRLQPWIGIPLLITLSL